MALAALGSLPLLVALVVTGCAGTTNDGPDPSPPSSAASTRAGDPATGTAAPSGSPSSTPTDTPTARPVRPGDFDTATAWAAVRHLSGEVGPRHATSPAYRRAVRWVSGELRDYGLQVRRQSVDVPAGNSWGTPVEAGISDNVIATPAGFDPSRPHLVVGAHLDTVPVAPGAEDNGSGVGTLLAVAEAMQGRDTRLPVVLIAFGAEEPRGEGDANHHYGSRAYVDGLPRGQQQAIRGMLSLDRVGVGEVVPVGIAADDEPNRRWRAEVLRAARRAGVPTVEDVNASSDHWSFVRRGLPGVRLGSTSWAGYHSADDVIGYLSREQLGRTGRLVLAWLAPGR